MLDVRRLHMGIYKPLEFQLGQSATTAVDVATRIGTGLRDSGFAVKDILCDDKRGTVSVLVVNNGKLTGISVDKVDQAFVVIQWNCTTFFDFWFGRRNKYTDQGDRIYQRLCSIVDGQRASA
jgi:hypothetical protein